MISIIKNNKDILYINTKKLGIYIRFTKKPSYIPKIVPIPKNNNLPKVNANSEKKCPIKPQDQDNPKELTTLNEKTLKKDILEEKKIIKEPLKLTPQKPLPSYKNSFNKYWGKNDQIQGPAIYNKKSEITQSPQSSFISARLAHEYHDLDSVRQVVKNSDNIDAKPHSVEIQPLHNCEKCPQLLNKEGPLCDRQCYLATVSMLSHNYPHINKKSGRYAYMEKLYSSPRGEMHVINKTIDAVGDQRPQNRQELFDNDNKPLVIQNYDKLPYLKNNGCYNDTHIIETQTNIKNYKKNLNNKLLDHENPENEN